MKNEVKLISFYLPQYHPIPENNEWWGPGFTEWTNVSAARPRFDGHHQPQLPADLGFYDLRLAESREAQCKLARQYGLYGFCYYHYWFEGERILQRPFDEVIKSKEPKQPFCLCWANETWTRAWDGLDRQVLKKQTYSHADNESHIKWLVEVFKDERYIKVNGKPVFLIYRIENIPDSASMIKMWRERAASSGLAGIYISAVRSGFHKFSDEDLIDLGVDSIVDFQPNRNDFPSDSVSKTGLYRLAKKILPDFIYQNIKLSVTANLIINYKKLVDIAVSKVWPDNYVKNPCVFPSWDNSARRKAAVIIQNDEPNQYKRWLITSIQRVQKYPEQERIVFINAWNEWAEGCHLEPDLRNKHGFLKATADALAETCK